MHLVLALLSEPHQVTPQPPAARDPVRALSRSESLRGESWAATWGRSRSRPGVAADSARPGRAGKRSERCNPRSAPVKVSLRRSRFQFSRAATPQTMTGPALAKRRTVRPGDVSVSRQFQNAELLGQETGDSLFDGVFGPLIEVGGPRRAVIGGDRGNAPNVLLGRCPSKRAADKP